MSPARRHTLVAVLLSFLGLLAYAGSRHNGFVWDDNFQIVRNPFLHSNQSVTRVLFSDVWGYIRAGQEGLSNYYRPLQMLTYRWTAGVAGLNPAAFHWVSIVLNLLASFAAYLVLWQLTRRWALAVSAAVLFAVHPIHSEAVLWIAGLTELGCALFYFLAFWLFLLARERQDLTTNKASEEAKDTESDAPAARAHASRWLFAGAGASFFVALLWKEMALTLPLVVVAYQMLASRRERWTTRLREASISSLPFWGVLAVYLAIRVLVLGYFSKVQHSLNLGLGQLLLNMFVLVGEYWLRLLIPLKLNAFHVFHPVRTLTDPRAVLAILFVVAAVAMIVFGARRFPLPSFAGAWVSLTLVPVLNLQGVGENVFAERYLYIPSLGFALLVAWLAAEVGRKMPAAAAKAVAASALCIISVAAVGQVWRRVPDWASDRALYTKTVELSPDAPLMRNSLAQIRRDQDGDLAAAEREYQTALTFALQQNNRPQAANSYLGLAGIASRSGRYNQAMQYIDKGMAQYDLPSLHIGQGILLLQTGHVTEARQQLELAHRFFPYDEVVLNSLGLIAMVQKDSAQAIDYLRQAVDIAPTYADGFNNLGRAYADAGNLPQSIASFRRAVELAPANAQFITNLGVALAKQGHYGEARIQFQRALYLAPSYGPAVSNLRTLETVQGHAPQ